MPLKTSRLTGIVHEKVLLVEGKDEVNFFEVLLKHLGLNNIQTMEVGGKDKFLDEFPTFLVLPGFERVTAYAIIRDADTNHGLTLESIKGLLKRHNQPCPRRSGEFESISASSCKVGIFIIPGNAETGMLESLCLQTVADHPVMSCVNKLMRCLDENLTKKLAEDLKDRGKSWYPRNEEKARLHIFLSSMHEVTTSIGLAAQKGYWNFEHDALSDLRDFLKKLAE